MQTPQQRSRLAQFCIWLSKLSIFAALVVWFFKLDPWWYKELVERVYPKYWQWRYGPVPVRGDSWYDVPAEFREYSNALDAAKMFVFHYGGQVLAMAIGMIGVLFVWPWQRGESQAHPLPPIASQPQQTSTLVTGKKSSTYLPSKEPSKETSNSNSSSQPEATDNAEQTKKKDRCVLS